jgi:hypothetical protein
MTFKFTSDHFSNNLERMNTYVLPVLSKKTKSHILDIAPQEGRSTIWFLENLKDSHVTVLQNKPGKNLKHNLAQFGTRVTIIEDFSQLKHDSQFDAIYIDLGPDSRFTLEAAVTCFPKLCSKGLMIFDDYTTDHMHGFRCPKPAIDSFANCYARYIKVIHASWQFILMKRTKPLSSKMCNSEYYHENVSRI